MSGQTWTMGLGVHQEMSHRGSPGCPVTCPLTPEGRSNLHLTWW